MKPVLILGAYGTFGKRIAKALAQKNIPVFLGGRNNDKLEELANQLQITYEDARISTIIVDIQKNLQQTLEQVQPGVVINTCGPFQNQDYSVALQSIDFKAHYIDLADGRDFVTGIKNLDALAKQNCVAVISGASTVPVLSSAVIEAFSNHFSAINSLRYGISPGLKTPRGLATTKAILSYVGRPILFPGATKTHYGWQDIHRQTYPSIGKRWMANCDIPDLDLLPDYYSIKDIRFSAGLENSILHLGLWLLSWLVRSVPSLKLEKHADTFLKVSNYFNRFGTADGGMHIALRGKNHKDEAMKLHWFIIAKNSHGPQIPTIPAIIMAEKLSKGTWLLRGAMPCIGLISLDEYLNELSDYCIETQSFFS